MPIINLAATTDPIDDLNILEVFYISWKRGTETFYLTDATSDGSQIKWTRNIDDGFQYITEDEARENASKVRRTGRKNVTVKRHTTQLDLDFDLEDLFP